MRQVYENCNEVPEGLAGDSVLITTTDDVDIGHGDLIVRADNLPSTAQISTPRSAG